MKLNNKIEIENFQSAINACKGEVYLKSEQGDVLNLKSIMTQYVAIGKLIADLGNDLELFCSRREDEPIFFKFFRENPEVL